MKIAIHQPNYLPYLGFFHKLAHCDLFLIYDTAQFVKGEYHNRNSIKGPNGPILLTLPVSKESHFKSLMHTMFDHTILQKHRTMISQAYAKAPFFKLYKSVFEKLYMSYEGNNLNTFNTMLIREIAAALDIHTPIAFVSEYTPEGEEKSTDALISICTKASATSYLSGAGARVYLEQQKFDQAHIGLEFQAFHHPTYHQLWGDFCPYMCALDLLFNEGPESKQILLGSS